MRAELKYLGEGGSIVNIASVAGVFGQWFASSYTAAKHGVVGLTKVAAKDYGDKGIRINAICPGPIVTPLFQEGVDQGLYTPEKLGVLTQLKRCGQPEEIGYVCAFLLGEGASYVTGCAYLVDGGFMA
ncbi:NAD(P)-binding protein, partial [Calocera viscosa TUFC12733]